MCISPSWQRANDKHDFESLLHRPSQVTATVTIVVGFPAERNPSQVTITDTIVVGFPAERNPAQATITVIIMVAFPASAAPHSTQVLFHSGRVLGGALPLTGHKYCCHSGCPLPKFPQSPPPFEGNMAPLSPEPLPPSGKQRNTSWGGGGAGEAKGREGERFPSHSTCMVTRLNYHSIHQDVYGEAACHCTVPSFIMFFDLFSVFMVQDESGHVGRLIPRSTKAKATQPKILSSTVGTYSDLSFAQLHNAYTKRMIAAIRQLTKTRRSKCRHTLLTAKLCLEAPECLYVR